jgi:hypothetical protein
VKSSMSAQPIGILHRLRSAFNILSAIRAGEGCNPVHDINFHKRLLQVADEHFIQQSPLSAYLILGAGKSLPKQLFSTLTVTT